MKPGVLTFYRIMAYVTAVLLIALCLTMVLKYAWPEGSAVQQFGDTWTTTIGIGHGYLYIVYLFIALVATVQLKAPLGRMILVLLAGTIPFGAFFAERKVTLWQRLRLDGKALPGETPVAEGTGSAQS
ncbi:DUF3817 domain-containing protein [Saccharopolyspora taberi]|uniref:DUF3817 domain-containing protein n=1 Tax=Saccharopolyspora taberi TaxID=60895 RepID=UPI0031CF6100